jgi:phage shock protein C
MFCTRCGVKLEDQDRYCFECGTPTEKAREESRTQPPVRLTRTVNDRKIAGVCGGFARYLNMDPTLVRVLWLLLTFGLPPAGIIGYIAAWIIIPTELEVPPEIVPERPNESPASV